jgi:hypothetical protein
VYAFCTHDSPVAGNSRASSTFGIAVMTISKLASSHFYAGLNIRSPIGKVRATKKTKGGFEWLRKYANGR